MESVDNGSTALIANASVAYSVPLILKVLTGVRLLIVLGILCVNLLVILALRLESHFNEHRYHIIASLAVADILMIFPYIYFDFIYVWLGVDNPHVCIYFVLTLYQFSATTSIYHLLLIAIDQYISVCHPISYKVWVTKRRMIAVIATVWIFSAAAVSPPLLGWSDWHGEQAPCTFRPFYTSEYLLLQSFIGYFIPAAVIIRMYIRILEVAWKQIRNARRMEIAMTVPSNPSTTSTANKENKVSTVISSIGNAALTEEDVGEQQEEQSDAKQKQNAMRVRVERQWKAVKTMVVVIVAFICCWLLTMLNFMCQTLLPPDIMAKTWFGTQEFAVVAGTLALVNSLINPFIYGLGIEGMHKAYVKVLKKCVCRE